MSYSELRRLYKDYYFYCLGATANAIRIAGTDRKFVDRDFQHAKAWARKMCQEELVFRSRRKKSNVTSNYVALRDGVAF